MLSLFGRDSVANVVLAEDWVGRVTSRGIEAKMKDETPSWHLWQTALLVRARRRPLDTPWYDDDAADDDDDDRCI